MNTSNVDLKNAPLKDFVVAIDFDGTCVAHKYPEIGKSIGAEPVLKSLVDRGARLILWTMRSGTPLACAVEWFRDRGIPLWSINYNPDQFSFSFSPKAYAHLYIDDGALGIPLIKDNECTRPYVDWEKAKVLIDEKVENLFIEPIVHHEN